MKHCRGTCGRHAAGAGWRLESGTGYCAVCCITMRWDGITCPCCGNTIRRRIRCRRGRAAEKIEAMTRRI